MFNESDVIKPVKTNKGYISVTGTRSVNSTQGLWLTVPAPKPLSY